ncbi:MAG: SGNH/GDSL hydrolase family protein [Candidatus Daviesbacteria bacterium]|nr:MAG: SGNH/GDSL hydrolase family protein [Candidatus Daviesbacteria bacterium]
MIISFLNFNPLGSLERIFAQPLHLVKKTFNIHTVTPKNSYTIVLVGDSMTDYLGPTADILKNYLKEYYPNKKIEVKNFSVGSTNILTLPDRLQNLTNFNGTISQPILNYEFDVIIIESFGHNPLSDPKWEDGFKKHNEVLDKAREMIKQRRPQAIVILMSTIAPHSDRYAEGVVNLTTDERKQWARHRSAYIKNHIKYARDHQIPLINIYEKSLADQESGNIDYINTHDFIHPSPTGILFISQEIANFIYKNRILPL